MSDRSQSNSIQQVLRRSLLVCMLGLAAFSTKAIQAQSHSTGAQSHSTAQSLPPIPRPATSPEHLLQPEAPGPATKSTELVPPKFRNQPGFTLVATPQGISLPAPMDSQATAEKPTTEIKRTFSPIFAPSMTQSPPTGQLSFSSPSTLLRGLPALPPAQPKQEAQVEAKQEATADVKERGVPARLASFALPPRSQPQETVEASPVNPTARIPAAPATKQPTTKKRQRIAMHSMPRSLPVPRDRREELVQPRDGMGSTVIDRPNTANLPSSRLATSGGPATPQSFVQSQPTQTQPAQTQPTQTQPTQTQPTPSQPTQSQPVQQPQSQVESQVVKDRVTPIDRVAAPIKFAAQRSIAAQSQGALPAPPQASLQAGPTWQEPNRSAIQTPAGSIVSQDGVIAEPAWTFNFQGAPWDLVLKNFAQASNMSLFFESQPNGNFTFFDQRSYTLDEALDILNDHLLRDGHLLVRNARALTLVSTSAQIRDGTSAFAPLSAIPTLGRNELVSVPFALKGAATPEMVQEVQQVLSPLGTVLPLSNSNRIIVTDVGWSLRRLRDLLSGSGLAASDIQQEIIRLKHTSAVETAEAINNRLGGNLGGASDVVTASAVGSGGAGVSNAGYNAPAVVAEAQTNSLLIQGTPDELARIDELVQAIDRDPGQVMIQALLVEVTLGNAREQGVELGFQDSVLFDRSVIDNIVTVAETITSPNGVQTTNNRILSQTAAPGFNFNGSPLGNNVTVNPSSIGEQGITNLGLGRVSGDLGFGGLVLSAGSNSVNVMLRALAQRFELDVLSRPHVRAINRREALIQIGQQVPVVDGVTLSANGIANPVVRQDKAGIILRVIPTINDDQHVQIEVQAEKSAYQLVSGSGVPIFTDAASGNVIEAPVKDITTAETTVTARTGQTIVLGGLISTEDSTVERRVPVLSNIPLIGRLFRVDLSRKNRKELLIFLTPTIIRNEWDSNALATAEANRMSLCPDECNDLHQDFFEVQSQEVFQMESDPTGPMYPSSPAGAPVLHDYQPGLIYDVDAR